MVNTQTFFVDSPVNGNEASTGAGGERRGNYATLNPLDCQSNNGALSNGNLDIKQTATNWAMYRSTMFVSSGKYYWEVTLGNNQYSTIGICSSAYQMANSSNNWANAGSEMFGYYPYDGNVYNGSNTISYATGDTSASGSVIGVALDLDNGTLAFYKDGTSLGQATSGLVGQSWSPTHWLYSQTNADSYNFGQRSFSQTPPAGYSPLATSFLPEPTIKRGDEAMDVALYEGNGTSQTIDNLRLSPGLVWIKNRDGSYNHVLFDVVRGAGGSKVLFSNRTTAEGGGTGEEGAAYGHVSSFNDDGFTVAKGTGNPLWVSNSSQSYVSWVWDAGDTTTTIAAGSLNSSAYASKPEPGVADLSIQTSKTNANLGSKMFDWTYGLWLQHRTWLQILDQLHFGRQFKQSIRVYKIRAVQHIHDGVSRYYSLRIQAYQRSWKLPVGGWGNIAMGLQMQHTGFDKWKSFKCCESS